MIKQYSTKIVGVTFENRQDNFLNLKPRDELQLVREPANQYDGNAIAVKTAGGDDLGYIPRALASRFSPLLDTNEATIKSAYVKRVLGGLEMAPTYGAEIIFTVEFITHDEAKHHKWGEAVNFVTSTFYNDFITHAILQRKLQIGYPSATRLMDDLVKSGIVEALQDREGTKYKVVMPF